MSIDRIAFPLPAIVKGYACLTRAEVELANRDIDPARPRDGPNGRDAPAQASAEATGTTAEPAPPPAARITSYAPGAVRTASAEKATLYSVTV